MLLQGRAKVLSPDSIARSLAGYGHEDVAEVIPRAEGLQHLGVGFGEKFRGGILFLAFGLFADGFDHVAGLFDFLACKCWMHKEHEAGCSEFSRDRKSLAGGESFVLESSF